MTMTKLGEGATPGPWDFAVDSYGKVRHSRKYDCVFTTKLNNGVEQLYTVAARIQNPNDARLIAKAKLLIEARGILETAIIDGRLQTFEDRERFRSEARALLAKLEAD